MDFCDPPCDMYACTDDAYDAVARAWFDTADLCAAAALLMQHIGLATEAHVAQLEASLGAENTDANVREALAQWLCARGLRVAMSMTWAAMTPSAPALSTYLAAKCGAEETTPGEARLRYAVACLQLASGAPLAD